MSKPIPFKLSGTSKTDSNLERGKANFSISSSLTHTGIQNYSDSQDSDNELDRTPPPQRSLVSSSLVDGYGETIEVKPTEPPSAALVDGYGTQIQVKPFEQPATPRNSPPAATGHLTGPEGNFTVEDETNENVSLPDFDLFTIGTKSESPTERRKRYSLISASSSTTSIHESKGNSKIVNSRFSNFL